MKVQVVPYSSNWPDDYAFEAARIHRALGDIVARIHHIGSTAIPGIHAKPIIDILLEVQNLEILDSGSSGLVKLGYEVKGEFGIPGRRYFRKDAPDGVRTHQIHAFEQGSPGSERHLAFRDYMISHPQIAQSYSLLKRRLAAASADKEAYMDGKDAFIRKHEAKAVIWSRGLRPLEQAEPDLPLKR